MFQIQSFTCEGLRDHLVTDCAAPTFAYFVSSDRAGASAVNPTGVGIGLSLAQGLIDAQDGTICASNARDEAGRVTGARFDIAFFKAIV